MEESGEKKKQPTVRNVVALEELAKDYGDIDITEQIKALHAFAAAKKAKLSAHEKKKQAQDRPKKRRVSTSSGDESNTSTSSNEKKSKRAKKVMAHHKKAPRPMNGTSRGKAKGTIKRPEKKSKREEAYEKKMVRSTFYSKNKQEKLDKLKQEYYSEQYGPGSPTAPNKPSGRVANKLKLKRGTPWSKPSGYSRPSLEDFVTSSANRRPKPRATARQTPPRNLNYGFVDMTLSDHEEEDNDNSLSVTILDKDLNVVRYDEEGNKLIKDIPIYDDIADALSYVALNSFEPPLIHLEPYQYTGRIGTGKPQPIGDDVTVAQLKWRQRHRKVGLNRLSILGKSHLPAAEIVERYKAKLKADAAANKMFPDYRNTPPCSQVQKYRNPKPAFTSVASDSDEHSADDRDAYDSDGSTTVDYSHDPDYAFNLTVKEKPPTRNDACNSGPRQDERKPINGDGDNRSVPELTNDVVAALVSSTKAIERATDGITRHSEVVDRNTEVVMTRTNTLAASHQELRTAVAVVQSDIAILKKQVAVISEVVLGGAGPAYVVQRGTTPKNVTPATTLVAESNVLEGPKETPPEPTPNVTADKPVVDKTVVVGAPMTPNEGPETQKDANPNLTDEAPIKGVPAKVVLEDLQDGESAAEAGGAEQDRPDDNDDLPKKRTTRNKKPKRLID